MIGKIACWLGLHDWRTEMAVYGFFKIKSTVCRRCDEERFLR